jgi:hypothetical protein
MKESEFIQQHPKRGKIQQTSTYIEKGAHELKLMSQRQHMTVTQLRAQVGVLQKWLHDLEEWLQQAGEQQETSRPT